MYDLNGNQLWRKKVDHFYPPFYFEPGRDAEGLLPLRDGLVGVMTSHAIKGEPYVANVTLTTYDQDGAELWTLNKFGDSALRYIVAVKQRASIIALSKSARTVMTKWWLNSRLSELFQRFGIMGIDSKNSAYRLHIIGYDGKTIKESGDILISLSGIKSVVANQDGKAILLSTGHKIFCNKQN